MNREKAVITGTGAVSAAGNNLEETFRSFSSKKRDPKKPSLFSTCLDYPVFQIEDIPSEFKKRKRRTLSLVLWALDQALGKRKLPKKRIGVCLGTTVASQLNDINFYKAYRKTKNPSADPVKRYLNSNLSANIANIYKLKGPACTIVNACSSGADSIGIGFEWLKNDICDMVICGGADELSLVPYCGFISLGIVSKKPCTPFDKERQGLNLGEGAGILILEKEKIARENKKDTNLFIAGYGSQADAYHLTAPHPEGKGLKTSINIALKEAELSKEDISFINAHGTATRENDKIEGKVIKEIFGNNIKFSSTKGYTGHTLGAAGGLEAIFTTESLKQGWIPPNIGFNKEDEQIGCKPVKDKQKVQGSYALSTSSAFGGNNIALIIGKR